MNVISTTDEAHMVQTRIDKHTGLATIVLKPNNSSSWQFNMRVVFSLALIAFFMSGYFALHDLWLIFPFGVFEIGFVFTCLYLRMRANIKPPRRKRAGYSIKQKKKAQCWSSVAVITQKNPGSITACGQKFLLKHVVYT